MKIQESVNNVVNDLCHETKFENRVKKQKYEFFLFLEKNFLRFLRIQFFAEADTKTHRYALTKASAFADC